MRKIFDRYRAAAFFNSNGSDQGWGKNILMAGNRETEPEISSGNHVFGFISYDYKNKIEKLISGNPNYSGFGKDKQFFTAEYCQSDGFNFPETVNNITKSAIKQENILCRTAKEEYILHVQNLKRKIQEGQIYEINHCIEFYVENTEIDPVGVYQSLNNNTQAPWSCLLKSDDRYIISASPECFLKKRGNKLSSHPIKGTARRSYNTEEDFHIGKSLLNDKKERGENIMITDLVRNDLSKIAEKSSVKVDELCGLYTFKTVHQLISSVSCTLKPETGFDDIIRSTFPMGSMTGAPKVRAMQLIDEEENFSRELYSGSCGYISPDGNFDFNVIIRSILYNRNKKYISFPVGSAITALSDPEKEYEECLLKAKAMINALTGS